jgi:hypothetical protein
MKYLPGILFTSLLGYGLYMGTLNLVNMPDVHISNTTGECVKVINYDERFDYTCENYPSKYNHVWVQ